jgi:hypothetical protein
MGALLALLLAAGSPSPRWEIRLRLASLDSRGLEVHLTLPHAGGPLKVCSDFPGAEIGVRDLRLDDGRPFERSDRCWLSPAAPGPAVALSYRFDLRRMASAHGDPDTAMEVTGGFIFNDDAVILRPDPCPERATLDVRLELPDGASFSAPWEPAPSEEKRFFVDLAQYRSGSYVGIGRLRPLGTLSILDGTASLAVFEGARAASDDGLRRWVGAALSSVARFYGALPGERVRVILVPAAGSDASGLFGSALRQGRPSVVLLFGARAQDAAFAGDWVAYHELFHLGNPPVQGRLPWFIEGVATYYQDLLRAREGVASAQAMAADLWDGFRRFCGPEGGRSLSRESRAMSQTHRFTRVYWGGACLAFALDVAIRERSQNRRSLDDVLRALRTAQMPLSEDELVAALDEAAGASRTRAMLDATRAWDVEGLFRSLGIIPTGPDSVRLSDRAPLAAIRRSILGETDARGPDTRGPGPGPGG